MGRRLVVLEGGGRLLGVDASSVREVVPSRSTTRIPGAPDFVRGLLNLRGTLVTVIDLSHRLTGSASSSDDASIAVVSLPTGRLLGLLVDDVHEVLELDDSAIAPPPAASASGGPGLVAGLGHFDDQIVLLIDVQELARQTLA